MDEIIIKENKKKVIKLIILGIIFLMVGTYTLVMGLIAKELFYAISGVIITVLIGTSLLFTVKTFIAQTPLLLIGKDGITDTSTASSVGFINWQEIQSINVQKSFGQEYIGITVYDLNKLMKRISIVKQVAMKANLIFKYPPVAISLLTADIELNEVVSIMQRRMEEYKTKQ